MDKNSNGMSKVVGMEIAIIMVIIGILIGGIVGYYMHNPNTYVNNSKTNSNAFSPDMPKLNGIANTFSELYSLQSSQPAQLQISGVAPAVCFNISNNGKLAMFGCTSDYNLLVMATQDSAVTVGRLKAIINQVKQAKEEAAKPIPKTDKPVVKLFVMSHCPYGTQMQKAIIPVVNLFKDKIQFEPEFVNYTMHGPTETKDNTIEYCINKNYPTKYVDFLKCYLADGKVMTPGNTTKCMKNVSINITEINNCVADTYKTYGISDKSAYYPIYQNDNVKYGVKGSPTLVINGKTVNVGRTPEMVKEEICKAFTTQPPECNITLSNEPVSPGFGKGKAADSPGGWCGN